MKKIFMLIGIPGSGKSTWLKNQDIDLSNTAILSTDNHIDTYANSIGKTHDSVYREYIKTAEKLIKQDAANAVADNKDVYWDQTNTSVKVRRKKLNRFKDYYKVAVYFTVPSDNELKIRLQSRPGKTISHRTMQMMTSILEIPTLEEGFDEIIIVENK